MNIKALVPATVKRSIKIAIRKYRDFNSGHYKKLAVVNNMATEAFGFTISLTQPVMQSAYFENKLHNIGRGIAQIEGLTLQPGEIFSFWHLVKKPSKRNDYKLGRNIISEQLSADYGGGLCQLSSIIYHLSITAGLEIIERHNHSIDIYKEEERFTPLGADATVVYGHKDLRISNPFSFPVRFSFHLADSTLKCMLFSPALIEQRTIEFERKYESASVIVSTKTRNTILHQDKYRLNKS